MADLILQMKGITKEFPGVKALNNVNLSVESGEVHALVGENGAGKSTLMNVLSGIYPFGTYSGEILFDGEICKFKNIRDSEKKGIVIIHQELALVPYLSIAENVYLGNECASRGIVNWHETYSKTAELLRRVRLKDSPATLTKDIGVGKQQLVEIAKALSKDVRLLILDEPTAALNDEDSENLLELLADLKNHGITSIIISHKLNEVKKISDHITIIRDGSCIETLNNEEGLVTEARIIKGMVGRELVDRFPKRPPIPKGEVVFEVKNWTVHDPLDSEKKRIKNISFSVRKGEVLGIVGLMGAGRTELAMSLFGRAYGTNISGQTFIDGHEVRMRTPKEAIEHGLAYLTEDRKTHGLVLIDDIRKNISFPSLKKMSTRGVVNHHKESLVAEEYRKKLNIKTPSVFQTVGNLSGGNQQKVILSRWIHADPKILILDEPTRGIDVGAKYEIYVVINELVANGKAVVIISSELPEVLGMSDRICVMNEGELIGELPREDASQESIMKCIMQHIAA